MRPLRRTTPDSRTTALDTRVTALERRFYEPASLWCEAAFFNPQSVPAGGSLNLAFDTFETNAPNDFHSIPSSAAGDTTISCAIFGVYLAVLVVEFEPDAVGYPHSAQIGAGRQRVTELSLFGPSGASASEVPWSPTGAVLAVGDVEMGVHSAWDYLSSQVATWEMTGFNGDAGPRDATRGSLRVTLLSADEDSQDPVVY